MPRKSWDLGSACSKIGTSSSESHYDSHSRQSWRRMPDQGEGRGNTMKVKHRPALRHLRSSAASFCQNVTVDGATATSPRPCHRGFVSAALRPAPGYVNLIGGR